MTKTQLEKVAGRPAPSEAERRIAARVVVRANKARKVQTPQWIKDLAEAS